MSELMAIRHAKDEFFARDTHSPLTADQKAPFAGLEYFADNGDLRLEVVARAHPDPGPVQLQTSTGGVQAYTRVGMFALRAGGQEAQLTIYEGPMACSGRSWMRWPGRKPTRQDAIWSPRRFLEATTWWISILHTPYCAYKEQWSCPLFPPENRINVPIRAGEMIFRDLR